MSRARRPILTAINGEFSCALLLWMASILSWPENDILGYPHVGSLPKAYYSSTTKERKATMTEQQLHERIGVYNKLVVSRLRELPHSGAIAGEVEKDVAIGAMREPAELHERHIRTLLMTRRIPVEEFKGGIYKVRVADHATESGANPSTSQADSMRHDTIESLVWIQLRLMTGNVAVRSWKRDVKRAFKRVPVARRHRWCAGSVWVADGKALLSEHLGMPFGTVSVGAGWHRMINIPASFLRTVLWVTFGRYVDDFFGNDRATAASTGGIASTRCYSCLAFRSTWRKQPTCRRSLQR